MCITIQSIYWFISIINNLSIINKLNYLFFVIFIHIWWLYSSHVQLILWFFKMKFMFDYCFILMMIDLFYPFYVFIWKFSFSLVETLLSDYWFRFKNEKSFNMDAIISFQREVLLVHCMYSFCFIFDYFYVIFSQ